MHLLLLLLLLHKRPSSYPEPPKLSQITTPGVFARPVL
jgi:hypothetical protein